MKILKEDFEELQLEELKATKLWAERMSQKYHVHITEVLLALMKKYKSIEGW